MIEATGRWFDIIPGDELPDGFNHRSEYLLTIAGGNLEKVAVLQGMHCDLKEIFKVVICSVDERIYRAFDLEIKVGQGIFAIDTNHNEPRFCYIMSKNDDACQLRLVEYVYKESPRLENVIHLPPPS